VINIPRYNVCHNNRWACFSSVVDDFITTFVTIDEYEEWRKNEYGRSIHSLEEANKMSINEALDIIKFRHGEERYFEAMIGSNCTDD